MPGERNAQPKSLGQLADEAVFLIIMSGRKKAQPKPLAKLAEEKIVSIIKTSLRDQLRYLVRSLPKDNPLQHIDSNLFRIEQDIRKTLNFFQDLSIIPQCVPEVQEIQKRLENMAKEYKKIREERGSQIRKEPGMGAESQPNGN